MKFEIDIESEEFKKKVEESITESGLVQDKVQEIIESDEMQEILKRKIKEVLLSNKLNNVIKEKIKSYIIDDLDLDYDDDLRNEISKCVKEVIISSFKTK